MPARPALQHRLVEVWTWLPAFRAVAEVEHVQRAARDLHVTPSSLSRAIRLLEEHLGLRVFDRLGRNMQLNHEGQELLAAVRDGMRRIDDGIGRITNTVFEGELRVACEGDQPITFAWRAAARVMKAHPGLRTTVEETTAKAALVTRLMRGEIDVAIVTSPPDHPSLRVEHLGDLTYGIYCGVGHALYTRRDATMKVIGMHPFVAPTSLGDDGPGDQWPKGVTRTVALRLPALQPAIAVCASGALLAVLPDVAVAGAAERRLLRRLRSDDVPSSPIFAVRRRPIGDEETVDRAGAFVSELRADLGAKPLGARSSARRKTSGRRR